MKQVISSVFLREFRGYFHSPAGYIFLLFFVLITNGIFFVLNRFFEVGQADMRAWFGLLPWIYLFFVPAFSMGIWSEERSRGTIEILLSTPVKEWQVVLAKFMAGSAFVAVALALTVTVPITIASVGDPDGGVIFASYLGAWLLGSTFLAVGSFLSALTRNQIVAFILSVTFLFVLLLAGHPEVIGMITRNLADSSAFSMVVGFFNWLGLLTHFGNISRGVVDTRDLVYYGVMTAMFLTLNVWQIQGRKWK